MNTLPVPTFIRKDHHLYKFNSSKVVYELVFTAPSKTMRNMIVLQALYEQSLPSEEQLQPDSKGAK